MRVSTGARRIRQKEYAARAKIDVVIVHGLLIKGCKEVNKRASRAELKEAVAVIGTSGVSVENTVPSAEVDIPRGIRSQTITALPDAGALAAASLANAIVIWTSDEDHRLLESASVISKHPTVVWTLVAVSSECYINRTTC